MLPLGPLVGNRNVPQEAESSNRSGFFDHSPLMGFIEQSHPTGGVVAGRRFLLSPEIEAVHPRKHHKRSAVGVDRRGDLAIELDFRLTETDCGGAGQSKRDRAVIGGTRFP